MQLFVDGFDPFLQIVEAFVEARVGLLNIHLQVGGFVLSVPRRELKGAVEVVH